MAQAYATYTYDHAKSAVWAVLADIGNVSEISSGIVASKRENKKQGVGGQRSCDFGKGAGILEEVTAWKKEEVLELTGIKFWGAPMKKMVAVFTFNTVDGKTVVDCNMNFEMKMGWILNLVAKGQMRKGIATMLAGVDAKLNAA